jgi:hypothetical protein
VGEPSPPFGAEDGDDGGDAASVASSFVSLGLFEDYEEGLDSARTGGSNTSWGGSMVWRHTHVLLIVMRK